MSDYEILSTLLTLIQILLVLLRADEDQQRGSSR